MEESEGVSESVWEREEEGVGECVEVDEGRPGGGCVGEGAGKVRRTKRWEDVSLWRRVRAR